MTSPVLPVSRSGRLLDLGAAVLVTGGSALYGYSYVGLERLRNAPEIAFSRGMVIGQLNAYHRLALVSWCALGLVGLGIAIAVYAWSAERKRRSG